MRALKISTILEHKFRITNFVCICDVHIKTVEEDGVTASVFRTNTPGVYLIVRSRIGKTGKATCFKSLTFVGENKVRGYEEDPEDLKPQDK